MRKFANEENGPRRRSAQRAYILFFEMGSLIFVATCSRGLNLGVHHIDLSKKRKKKVPIGIMRRNNELHIVLLSSAALLLLDYMGEVK